MIWRWGRRGSSSLCPEGPMLVCGVDFLSCFFCWHVEVHRRGLALCRSSDNARALMHWATRELLLFLRSPDISKMSNDPPPPRFLKNAFSWPYLQILGFQRSVIFQDQTWGRTGSWSSWGILKCTAKQNNQQPLVPQKAKQKTTPNHKEVVSEWCEHFIQCSSF